MDKTYFYGIKQKSKETGKIYYRDFVNFNWVEQINENCLLAEKWLAIQIGDKNWPGNYELVKFDLKEVEL